MTEEKIKQNAEAYAKERCIRYNEQYGACYDAYITGAHSRDREIMDLQHLLKTERISYKVLVEADIKLRNPWHSADELPKENPRMKGYSLRVIAYFGNMRYERAYVSIEERVWFQGGVATEKPVKWRYVPR